MAHEHDTHHPSRRDLLRGAALAGAGASLTALGVGPAAAAPRPVVQPAAATMKGVPFEPHASVRVAMVGTGLRGKVLVEQLLAVEGVRVTALADIVAAKAQAVSRLVVAAGQPEPALYTNGERDFERLVERDDIDLVITATPWAWHVPVCLAAMRAGRHAATEVPAATTVDECWALVDASERTRRHCLMLENCCYGYNEMLVLAMVRAGLFGEIKHAAAAYNHDLRRILFENKDEGLWRRQSHVDRNGNLYPTHGLGPVALYLDINRGDRFDYLVSMSTPEFGLSAWREAEIARDDPKWRETYRCGDLNSSLIRTVRGRTILLEHDVTSPRPYTRINRVQGTKGIFEDYPPRLYLEGQAGGEKFAPIDAHKARYEHPLWTRTGELARTLGGHGGMDFVMLYRLVECMRQGAAPDMDVYDAAAWSVPGPLSEASVAQGSAPVAFPDFTRGHWKG
jgi:hypothetical protein